LIGKALAYRPLLCILHSGPYIDMETFQVALNLAKQPLSIFAYDQIADVRRRSHAQYVNEFAQILNGH